MHTEQNPTKYRMYLNYDNDRKVYVFPRLPDKIKVTSKGKTASVDIDRFGEVLHKGKRDAITISFSSFFPAQYGQSYCACMEKEFKSPKKWNAWILKMQAANKPCHFVLEGSPLSLNMYADIISYSATEEGGDVGTISYTLELKEHRKPTVSTHGKKGKGKKARKTTTGKRASNESKKKAYTIKKGDCLWNIAKKYYGKGIQYTKILNANRATLDKAAKRYGYSGCRDGNLIFPGTKITIP